MVTLNIHQDICDFFFDGKLYRTCVLDGNIKVEPNHAMIIGNNGGFDGFVSNVIYANKALHPGRIYEKYLRGPRFQLSVWERIKYMFMPARKDIKKQIEAEAEKGSV